jgi:hypothetical protein
MTMPATDRDDARPEEPTPRDRGADGADAMGAQTIDEIKSSLPPGAGTKPADARGDVDRLEPYDEQVGPLRMSDVDVTPAELEE